MAQLWVKAKTTISAGIYIFAGVKTWSKIQEGDDLIECSKLEKGEVKFGKLVETGEIKETIKIGDRTYDKNEVKQALREVKSIN